MAPKYTCYHIGHRFLIFHTNQVTSSITQHIKITQHHQNGKRRRKLLPLQKCSRKNICIEESPILQHIIQQVTQTVAPARVLSHTTIVLLVNKTTGPIKRRGEPCKQNWAFRVPPFWVAFCCWSLYNGFRMNPEVAHRISVQGTPRGPPYQCMGIVIYNNLIQ